MDFSRSGSWHRAFAAAPLLLVAWTACADDTPGFDRPGLGFATNALRAGQFAYEQGLPDWSRHHDGIGHTDLATYDSLLRLGLGHGVELQLSGSPYNRQRQTGDGPAQTSHGRGDTIVGVKWAPESGSAAWNWGVLGNVEFTDGARDFRSDRRVYTLGTVIDQKVSEPADISYYLQWQRSGGHDNFLLAPAFNYQIDDHWGFYLETALLRDADHHAGTQAGSGLTWAPWPSLQFDTWFRHRLGGRAAQWEAGFGVAMLFGQ